MDRFAYVVHYPSYTDFIRELEMTSKTIAIDSQDPDSIKRAIWEAEPRVWFRIRRVQSSDAGVASGVVVLCPFIPEHIATMGEQAVLEKLRAAANLAVADGARVIGLAGFASIVGDEGSWLSKQVSIPVTSGNTYTASLVVDGIRQAARMRDVELKSCKMAIVGAMGDIGSICAKIFFREVGQLSLVVRGEQARIQLNKLLKATNVDARATASVREGTRDADIILTATNSVTTLIGAEDVKPGCIICDVAVPHNVASNILTERTDVFAFDGGLSSLPAKAEVDEPRGWAELSPDGHTVFGCLAEVMLLALDRSCQSPPVGRGRITEQAVENVKVIAEKHGFRLAKFRYNNRLISAGYSMRSQER